MRRFIIAFAGVAGVLACQAYFAESRTPFHLTKPNISDEQFRRDRDDCIAKATTSYEGSCVAVRNYGPFLPGSPQSQSSECIPRPGGVEHDHHGFLRCMQAKGYQEMPPPMPVGKAGLYEIRKFSNQAMFGGRDLSNTLPYAQRRASTEALARPGPVFQLCIPQDGTQQLGTVAGLSASCRYSNVITTPHGFSTDASCGGQSVHVTFEAESADHREFTVYRQPAAGAVVSQIDKYQINWISPDCGAIPPGAVRMPDGTVVPMKKPAN